ACLFLPETRPAASRPSAPFPGRTISRGRIVDRPVASGVPCFRGQTPGQEDAKTLDGRESMPPNHLTLRDLWLPLALAILMTALVLGLQVLGTDVVWLDACLLIGLPGAICYTFIGRPIRFALGIAAILLVGRFGRDVLHSRVVY